MNKRKRKSTIEKWEDALNETEEHRNTFDARIHTNLSMDRVDNHLSQAETNMHREKNTWIEWIKRIRRKDK